MKKITFLSLFLMTVLASAQTKVIKTLGDFSELKVYNGIEVELIKSDKQEIEITGAKAEKVKVKIKRNTLKVYLSFPESAADGKVHIKLFFNKEIAIIDANEGAVITGKGFEQKELEAKVQEGAFINLVVKTNYLKVKASSGGIIKVSGTSKNQQVAVDLGGVYHGYNLDASSMSVVRAGSGAKAEVKASKTLDAKVSFGGSIYYKGTPKILKDKKVIGGVIEQRG